MKNTSPIAFNPKPQTAGGLALVAKYGSAHMSQIGKRGYQTTVERYFDGDRKAANEWLAKMGRFVADAGYRKLGLGKFPNPGPHPAHQEGSDVST